MMLCRVDHTDPSVDTSQWETQYHGGNFYGCSNICGSGLLPFEGHDLVTPVMETAARCATATRVFDDEGWLKVIFELKVDPDDKTRGQIVELVILTDSPPLENERRFSKWNPDLECLRPGTENTLPTVHIHKPTGGALVRGAGRKKGTAPEPTDIPIRQCDKCGVNMVMQVNVWHCSKCNRYNQVRRQVSQPPSKARPQIGDVRIRDAMNEVTPPASDPVGSTRRTRSVGEMNPRVSSTKAQTPVQVVHKIPRISVPIPVPVGKSVPTPPSDPTSAPATVPKPPSPPDRTVRPVTTRLDEHLAAAERKMMEPTPTASVSDNTSEDLNDLRHTRDGTVLYKEEQKMIHYVFTKEVLDPASLDPVHDYDRYLANITDADLDQMCEKHSKVLKSEPQIERWQVHIEWKSDGWQADGSITHFQLNLNLIVHIGSSLMPLKSNTASTRTPSTCQGWCS
jgi:hypothetical protein